MRFDLPDLSLFRHVVEAGSITHGAERAHLALAAASTRIRNMEDALGVPLLTRGRAGVGSGISLAHLADVGVSPAGGRSDDLHRTRLCPSPTPTRLSFRGVCAASLRQG